MKDVNMILQNCDYATLNLMFVFIFTRGVNRIEFNT